MTGANVSVFPCFKCEKLVRNEDLANWSDEWDAICHSKCCPASNKEAKPDAECNLCEQMT